MTTKPQRPCENCGGTEFAYGDDIGLLVVNADGVPKDALELESGTGDLALESSGDPGKVVAREPTSMYGCRLYFCVDCGTVRLIATAATR